MKKLLPLLLILAVSCSTNDSAIQATTVQWTGAWVLDSAGNQNVQVMDTLYTVQPSGVEKVHMTRKRGDLWVFGIGLVVLISVIVWYIITTSRGNDKPAFVAVLTAAIMGCGAMIGGSVDWVHTLQETIPKHQYDSLINKDGNLHSFWNTIKY